MTTKYNPKGKGWTLTAEAFEKLLNRLDADRETAGEKYEDLRRALARYFEGRRISFAEERADEVFNRVSRKLIEGVQINNLYGYCYEVARLVLLEAQREPESKMHSIEEFDLGYQVTNTLEDEIEKEKLLKYLNLCLEKLPPESRALITEYYRHDQNDRVALRKAMSERLNLSREALANRAQRLRDKLEKCIERGLKMAAI
jgi:RNA polymerase sigma factor (sigma-70 family)